MRKMGEEEDVLFERRRVREGEKRRRWCAASVAASICLVLLYRLTHFPQQSEGFAKRVVWTTIFLTELWFSFYWLLTQANRWSPVLHSTFKHRLSSRGEGVLPAVDVFVCTADPKAEPPFMVANTVLSLMAFDYPPEKLSLYVSDDGCSHLTFYALLLAARFAKHWLPFCRRFNVQPRSPSAYFSSSTPPSPSQASDWEHMREMFNQMKTQIEMAGTRIPEEESSTLLKHRGFSQSPKDHDTVIQMLIDGRDEESKDGGGLRLPSLVYVAREKRPEQAHNFKAGAMNALLRVSAEMSNAGIILNVDCDMYSNNPLSVRDALCFFLDKEGKSIGFVQFAQFCHGDPALRDLYGNSLRVICELEFPGMDGSGGPMYIGSGCFHRRDALCGGKYSEGDETEVIVGGWRSEESPEVLVERVKDVAGCSYDKNTLWGKEKGVRYGFPVEDVVTGLCMQCIGWRSVFFKEGRKGFIGMAPTTLLNTLVQHKRWSEGDFLILVSKLCPLFHGFGTINLLLRMGYCCYCCWAPSSLPILFYSLAPSLLLLADTPLFPHPSTAWFIPFGHLSGWRILASFLEYRGSGGTAEGWWNDQRMWVYKRITSYLFGLVDACLGLSGWSAMGFEITEKVEEREVQRRYEEGLMEFGVDSPMFFVIATVGFCNAVCLAWVVVVKKVVVVRFLFQIFICFLIVVINLPLYSACFFRRDRGRMPLSVTLKSMALAILLCCCFLQLSMT